MKIFVEGGGKGTASACRRGFGELFAKLLPGKRASIVACGPRAEAYKSFCLEVLGGGPAMLLVDAERPSDGDPWAHLGKDGMPKPPSVDSDTAHLMVQCMEAWILSDAAALERYFGKDFQTSALPHSRTVEEIPKESVFLALKLASRHTSKGEYRKSRDGFELLARIQPAALLQKAPGAAAFVEAIRRRLDQG